MVLRAIGLCFVIAATSCGSGRTAAPIEGDRLLLSWAGASGIFDTSDGSWVGIGDRAVRVPNSDVVLAVQTHASRSELVRLDAGSRVPLGNVDETTGPVVVSPTGKLVALVHEPLDDKRHRVTVMGTGAGGSRASYELPGPAVPEAFSTDDSRLFLVHHLAPGRYRLIELDLETGAVAPLGARAKQAAPVEMVGAGRSQVSSPAGHVLYTLYTRQPASFPHGRPPGALIPRDGTAFVHVLDLEVGSAHCIELPLAFGTSSASSDALAISPDGASLFVIDAAAGRAVVIDATRLTPLGIMDLDLPEGEAGHIRAAAGREGTVLVTVGSTMASFEGSTLLRRGTWTLPAPVTALALGATGRAYVGAGEDVFVVNPDTKASPGRIGVPLGSRILSIEVLETREARGY